MNRSGAWTLRVAMAVGVGMLLATACGADASQSDTEEPSSEGVSASEVREDPYERIREVDPVFKVRSTLKVNPCDGRFMDLIEETVGLVWDESPTSMDGIAGGKSFTVCGFEDVDVSLLVVSRNIDFDVMEPNLEPRDDWDLPGAYWWEVGDRRAAVRPVDIAEGTCDVGIETSFGYMSFSGGYYRSDLPGDSCAAVKDAVDKLEPHLWD